MAESDYFYIYSVQMKSFVELNDGRKMPVMGLGTFEMNLTTMEQTIESAVLDLGIRHIDTASRYKNEEQIGNALKKIVSKGVSREELFITTKLWNTDRGNVEEALRSSLKKLQLDYVDLYLVHWPVDGDRLYDPKTGERTFVYLPKVPLMVVWKQMELCV